MEEHQLRYRHFLLIWFGQFASSFGTALTGFAISVWVYQETGSTSKLSFTLLSSSLPGVLSAPLIGSLIDRHDRRLMLILSNLGAFAGISLLALLFAFQEPGLVTICLLLAVVAVFRTAQWPTFSALITFLVPVERLGKANGLVELGRSVSDIGGPILAGFLISWMPIAKILWIDALTYFFALLILWRLSFQDVVEQRKERRKTLRGEAWEGFLYIWDRSGLLHLLVLFASLNFFTSILQVILTPLVLSMATAKELGLVTGIASGGMLLGGLGVSTWGVPQRKIRWILFLLGLQATALIVIGFIPGLITLTCSLFIFMTIFPIVSGMSQVLWQTRTERNYHGRVFSIRRTIATATVPVAYLISGPLADYFAAHFAPVFWGSPGLPDEARGLALLFSVLGCLSLVMVLLGARQKALHAIESNSNQDK